VKEGATLLLLGIAEELRGDDIAEDDGFADQYFDVVSAVIDAALGVIVVRTPGPRTKPSPKRTRKTVPTLINVLYCMLTTIVALNTANHLINSTQA
jgi:hypothetical protein